MSTLALILLIVLILAVVGGLPAIGLSQGYGPSGLLTIILIIVLIMALTGRL